MISTDEEALIADFVETYQILNYRQLSATLSSLLAVQLRENSRIKMKLRGDHSGTSLDTLLLSAIADRLSLLLWAQTKDGAQGINRPSLIVDALLGNESEETMSFDSGKDFEIEREKRLREIKERSDSNG